MDPSIIWKSMILFLSIYLFSWLVLYTFQPKDILGWENKIGLNNKQRQDIQDVHTIVLSNVGSPFYF